MMNNLSEEDSFAASIIDEEYHAKEESLVNQGRTRKRAP